MEQRLVGRVDRAVAVSETLRRRLAEMGRSSHLLTHGVDLDFWRSPGPADDSWDALPKPLVVFWGVIDRRMDTAFVRAWSAARTGTLLLVGPQNDPDPAIFPLPGVAAVAPLPLERLPGLARAAAALVMPYADLPVTRAMQPLKLKEYLATGLPVVARDLPANREWADCLDLVHSPEAFVSAIQRRLAEGVPEPQRAARRRLDGEGWDEKARQFERLIDE
jgi:glycosyltransferase involved in cell wall biosynthesis